MEAKGLYYLMFGDEIFELSATLTVSTSDTATTADKEVDNGQIFTDNYVSQGIRASLTGIVTNARDKDYTLATNMLNRLEELRSLGATFSLFWSGGLAPVDNCFITSLTIAHQGGNGQVAHASRINSSFFVTIQLEQVRVVNGTSVEILPSPDLFGELFEKAKYGNGVTQTASGIEIDVREDWEYDLAVSLGGEEYIFSFYASKQGVQDVKEFNKWYLTVKDSEGNVIGKAGKQLVVDTDFFKGNLPEKFSHGNLRVSKRYKTDDKLKRTNFGVGKDFYLVYIPN